jgi:hypothetical protein
MMKSPGDMEGISSPDKAYVVEYWMDPRQSSPQGDVEYHTSAAGKDSDFG